VARKIPTIAAALLLGAWGAWLSSVSVAGCSPPRRARSVYRAGARSRDWIKTKCFHTQRFAVVGCTTDLVGGREVLAALALAGEGDRYASRVEFGVPRRDGSLLEILRSLGARSASVGDAPSAEKAPPKCLVQDLGSTLGSRVFKEAGPQNLDLGACFDVRVSTNGKLVRSSHCCLEAVSVIEHVHRNNISSVGFDRDEQRLEFDNQQRMRIPRSTDGIHNRRNGIVYRISGNMSWEPKAVFAALADRYAKRDGDTITIVWRRLVR
jgi:hypothetical protein